MKTLCLILILGMSMPGCSMLSAKNRAERAYNKQLKEIRLAREKRQKRLIEHQRATMPTLRMPASVEPGPVSVTSSTGE
jgi:uncharacterized protein YceK